MKIIVTELIWPIGLRKLEEFAETVDYDPDLWKDRKTLLIKVKDYDAIIVRNQTRVDEELLKAGSQLKVIGRLGVGLDNIDLQAAKQHNTEVVFARNANATSVAEYVIASMLEAKRPLFAASQDVKNGNWNRKKFTKGELYKKTLGLVGLGEIAQRTAKRAISFGMNIVGFDPFVTEYDYVISETGIQQRSFTQLLAESDFISVHVPLTPTTKDLFSYAEFELMKNFSFIINTSRGGVINERALLDAVKNSRIGGAFLDVLEQEPPQSGNPLFQCENIFITPHIAGLTEESQERTSLLVAEEVGKVLKGDQALCTVR